MSNINFEDDRYARKIIKYLLFIEVFSLLVAIILVFLRYSFIAFILGLLTLIIFTSILIWLYIRFLSFPLVHEKHLYEKKASNLKKNIKFETNNMILAKQKRIDLSQEQSGEVASLLRDLQNKFIQIGLSNTLIASAKISGIGPKLKERLSSHQILSAADVNQSITAIEGFGEAKIRSILDWQTIVRNELDRIKPTILPNDQSETVNIKYKLLHDKNDTAEKNAIDSKKIFENDLNSFAPRLAELSPFIFYSYLRNSISTKGIFAITIALFLLFVQSFLALGTVSAVIVASIPTSTLTPTNTLTPTTTLTPTASLTPTYTVTATITNTPTITLTPTVTFAPTNSPRPSVTPIPLIISNPTSSHPSGTSGQCIDGTYTSSQTRRGACSHHGGIAIWWGN